MTDPLLPLRATLDVVYGALIRSGLAGTFDRTAVDRTGVDRTDRGAVSIEQVLWYAAAAVSVAVVAAIIWSQIRSTASTPVQQPSAP